MVVDEESLWGTNPVLTVGLWIKLFLELGVLLLEICDLGFQLGGSSWEGCWLVLRNFNSAIWIYVHLRSQINFVTDWIYNCFIKRSVGIEVSWFNFFPANSSDPIIKSPCLIVVISWWLNIAFIPADQVEWNILPSFLYLNIGIWLRTYCGLISRIICFLEVPDKVTSCFRHQPDSECTIVDCTGAGSSTIFEITIFLVLTIRKDSNRSIWCLFTDYFDCEVIVCLQLSCVDSSDCHDCFGQKSHLWFVCKR